MIFIFLFDANTIRRKNTPIEKMIRNHETLPFQFDLVLKLTTVLCNRKTRHEGIRGRCLRISHDYNEKLMKNKCNQKLKKIS